MKKEEFMFEEDEAAQLYSEKKGARGKSRLKVPFSKKNKGLKYDLNESDLMICGRLNFEATEAYKLLRTNIIFSFPQQEERCCKVIGITSAERGEGKSTTAINLSYTLALDGKNVLMIECDLRLPTSAARLKLKAEPGLSNILVGLAPVSDSIQSYGKSGRFNVITAGEIPPNPSELLGSERMEKLLDALKKSFDYIILDLPPVSAVADALIISKIVDGMLVVVRQDYADKNTLNDTIRQLNFINAKILGFVYNGVNENGIGYNRRSYYYKKKYSYYYKRRNSANES